MMETEISMPILAKRNNTHDYHPFKMADEINSLTTHFQLGL